MPFLIVAVLLAPSLGVLTKWALERYVRPEVWVFDPEPVFEGPNREH